MASLASTSRLLDAGPRPSARATRRLAGATLINSCGSGAWYTCWALFLTRSVGLAPAQVGLGITIAGALGLLASAPLGALADRLTPARLLVVMSLLQASGFAAYLAVHDFWAFLVVACATVSVDRGSIGVRSALALGAAGTGRGLDGLAAIRSAGSAGFAAGAALGALAIALDTRTGYGAIALINAGGFVVYALTVATLPTSGEERRRGRGVPRRALRDAPYATLSAITGVLALCWGMLSSGLPLWIARHTLVPLWVSAAIVFLNALTIAALQIPVTRSVRSPLRAARAARRAGAALAISCALFALSQGGGGSAVILILLAGAIVHVAGELLFVAAAWRLSVDLMPADAPGEYQGVFAMGQATAQMAAPAVMTTLVVGWGAAGWVVLAGLFTLAALPAVPATRWALASRPREEDA